MSNKRGVSAVGRGCLILQEPLNNQYIPGFLPKGQTAGAIYPLVFILCCLRVTYICKRYRVYPLPEIVSCPFPNHFNQPQAANNLLITRDQIYFSRISYRSDHVFSLCLTYFVWHSKFSVIAFCLFLNFLNLFLLIFRSFPEK